MNSKLSMALGIAALSLMPGCATQPVPAAPAGPSKVDIQLQDAANAVQLAMDNLVVAESARGAKAKYVPKKAPDGLDTKLNIKWNGSIGQLMENLKPVMKGYTLAVFGKEPSISVIVNIQSENISVYDVIRDAGIQAGARATVSIDSNDPDNRKVELRYPS